MSRGGSFTPFRARSCGNSESKAMENGNANFLHGLLQVTAMKVTPIPVLLVPGLTSSTYWRPHMLPSPSWYASWVRAAASG